MVVAPVSELGHMVGWWGTFEKGARPRGTHPWALVGAPPEMRSWLAGDPMVEPDIAVSALIDAFCTVDAGRADLPQTTTIGERTWLQKRVHVGHNAVIGADCELCVGVVVCGEVVIGDGVRVGGNSWIKPLVRIGDGAIIGGGSVVTRDVPAHEVWAGNPARFMKNALTHPAVRGQAGRESAGEQYAMTEREWRESRERALKHPFRDPEEVWEMMRPWHHRAGAGR